MAPVWFGGGTGSGASLGGPGWSTGVGASVARDVDVERTVEDLVTEPEDKSESVGRAVVDNLVDALLELVVITECVGEAALPVE